MIGKIDRTTRTDVSLSFDVGAYPSTWADEPGAGASFYLTLLQPQGINDGPTSPRWGWRVGISYFGFGTGSELIYLTPGGEGATASESSGDNGISGMRTFMGFELEIPVGIGSLRFSPGITLKYDDRSGSDFGAAAAVAFMIDLSASLFAVLHLTTDVYTLHQKELLTGGVGLGLSL